jgi:hypothetical protein
MTTDRVCNSIEISARLNLIFQWGSMFCFMLPLVWYLNMSSTLIMAYLCAAIYEQFATLASIQHFWQKQISELYWMAQIILSYASKSQIAASILLYIRCYSHCQKPYFSRIFSF